MQSRACIFLTPAGVRGTFDLRFDTDKIAGAHRANSPQLRCGEPARFSCDLVCVNSFLSPFPIRSMQLFLRDLWWSGRTLPDANAAEQQAILLQSIG